MHYGAVEHVFCGTLHRELLPASTVHADETGRRDLPMIGGWYPYEEHTSIDNLRLPGEYRRGGVRR